MEENQYYSTQGYSHPNNPEYQYPRNDSPSEENESNDYGYQNTDHASYVATSQHYRRSSSGDENDPNFTAEDYAHPNPNFPQPPMSQYNPAPNPVPYGNNYTPTGSGDNNFYLHVHPALQNKPAPSFELSNCKGRKRALLIGINYFNTPNELKGCINDVHNVKDFITTLYGFEERDMVILTDDHDNPKFLPTRANIISGMQWLVNDAQPNDSFFFHYSGHGGRSSDNSGDEDDSHDETIYPLDFEESGQLKDDDMHQLLVKPLCHGCRLTAIFDSCHSGTALDLPYVYSTRGEIKSKNLFKDAGMGLLSAGVAYAQGDRDGALSSLISLGQKLFSARDVEDEIREKHSSPADVIMFSGCKDDQTSADAHEAGKATGAMSYAFTSTLRENPNQSYQQLLNSVRNILSDKYAQRPQLSSSHPIDVDLEFVC
ncbi:caspase domain-containing protein [Radiomyces spectabilis]|uniref:caspase domain-containing protein n=1 Tax=Radiomyces spectabilis TaxID=64574 RepID=UPI00221E7C1E|nr:caspase domain-containing protein [Radiomyces spectabilis]KAI8394209.1 caspase domain-containing protein [Radiomyces spectabilis]